MQKIPTIFQRDPENPSLVSPEPTHGCEWVFHGEGVATVKYDGTCCMVSGGQLFKRREVKPGKSAPSLFYETDHDAVTGKRFGWVPVDPAAPEDRHHREAFEGRNLQNGTYELVGPKIQGNPEGYDEHSLVPHGIQPAPDAPRGYTALLNWLRGKDIEGLVWHHPDGRMAKIKLKDFGLERPPHTDNGAV